MGAVSSAGDESGASPGSPGPEDSQMKPSETSTEFYNFRSAGEVKDLRVQDFNGGAGGENSASVNINGDAEIVIVSTSGAGRSTGMSRPSSARPPVDGVDPIHGR